MTSQNCPIPGWVNPSFWKNKSICLTGGYGFLGKHVYEKLQEISPGNTFRFKRRDFDLRSIDEVNSLFKLMEFDIVIHLAANCGGIQYNKKYPASLFYDNLQMGINIIETCQLEEIKKLVMVGTVCSYPKFPKIIPFIEEELFDGYPEETNAPYGLAKRALLTMSQSYSKQYGMDIVYLIPANLYGEYDHFEEEKSHVIPALIKKVMEAKSKGKKEIEVWGTGKASREFLYASDCAEAIIKATQTHKGCFPINIGNGQEIKISNLVEILKELLEYEGEIYWNNRLEGQPRRCLNTEKAYKYFNFRASTQLKDGIKKIIEWCNDCL